MPSSKNERADRAARGLAAPTGEPLRDELAAIRDRCSQLPGLDDRSAGHERVRSLDFPTSGTIHHLIATGRHGHLIRIAGNLGCGGVVLVVPVDIDVAARDQ